MNDKNDVFVGMIPGGNWAFFCEDRAPLRVLAFGLTADGRVVPFMSSGKGIEAARQGKDFHHLDVLSDEAVSPLQRLM